jgi:hypothetical protein
MQISRLAPVLLLILFSSCEKIQDEDPVVNVPVTFLIEMEEKLQPGYRPLLFNLKSVEILDCANYQIDYKLEQQKRSIHLTLKDFSLEEPCQPQPATAQGVANLGPLEPGEYKLKITLKDVVQNEGVLSVRPEYYILYMETLDGIFFPEGLTRLRIPGHSIWGGVYPMADSLSALADEFMSELYQSAAPFQLIPGNYGPFSVSIGNAIQLVQPPAPGPGHTFVLRYGGSRNGLINLVEYYRNAGGPGLKIYLFDVEGFEY